MKELQVGSERDEVAQARQESNPNDLSGDHDPVSGLQGPAPVAKPKKKKKKKKAAAVQENNF